MRTTRLRVACAALALAGATGLADARVATASPAPVVQTDRGAVQGTAIAGGYRFLGVPYAAAPVGELRWRPPESAPRWDGVRDATEFGPNCPQPPTPFLPPGAVSEDCLYLNVYTPQLDHSPRVSRPVIVWIHGGGLVQEGARNYDPTKLATEGTVVVTINYRLGALGFLAHPAFASSPGGPAGNYGFMDQQAALRWVRRNIREFGGDPTNVTIAGQSAGGLSVLVHLASPSSRGLFDQAIVQSGSFAMTQLPLATAEAFGENYAHALGCDTDTAACLRAKPFDDLVGAFPPAAIPGVVDGRVLEESIGTALAAGHFAHVPVLNGMNHDEELIFVAGLNLAVSGGEFVQVSAVTAANYESVIASVAGVSPTRAAQIASEYPVNAYPLPFLALSTLLSDANFACTARQQDLWTSARVPTFAYQFNDDSAPPRYGQLPLATHTSELPYLIDLPNAPIQVPLSADQEQLAHTMRAAWASFAATGNPSTGTVPWPSFNDGERGLSLVTPAPQLDTDFATRHHCAFWGAA
jgi:para-nitrobenzyl esterase